MSSYCTVEDLQNILPRTAVIGANLTETNVVVLESQAVRMIEQTAGIVDSYLSAIYRVPLIQYKEPDFTQDPVVFTSFYPPPIVIVNTRLASANIYDYIVMGQQEPNVSEWGKNQRALAFDDLRNIQAGVIQLRGQVRTGMRFARMELFDPGRVPIGVKVDPQSRQPGQ